MTRSLQYNLNFQHDRFIRASVGSRNVSIITPTDNSSVTLPATVTIAANATDSDGSITKVDFYSNAILMSTASTAPYSVTLAGFTLGSYTFTAVATDNSGASTTSAPVHISVTSGVAQVYYIHTDQLNTPRLITDSTNTPVWRWDDADPFANNVPNDDPNATGSHFVFNQRLPGQYADKEIGTNYNYFRDIYFTDLGRYGQSDPIGLQGGINTFGYVGGNPLSYVDPTGQKGTLDAIDYYEKGKCATLIPKVEAANKSCNKECPADADFEKIIQFTEKYTSSDQLDQAQLNCICAKLGKQTCQEVQKCGIDLSVETAVKPLKR